MKLVLDYKTKKIADAQDWDTVRAKYEDILKSFVEAYPPEETEEFPRHHQLEMFTKERIASKVKKMKTGFRKALDSGRKSGGGRVVSSLYEECSEIWSGSPAAESIAGGIETALEIDSETEESAPAASEIESDLSSSSQEPDPEKSHVSNDLVVEPLKKRMKLKKEELSNILKDRRNSKSTKKVAFQDQMISFVKEDVQMKKEDLEIKRQLVEQYKYSEREFSATIKNLTETVSKTMSEGFMMMRMMFQPNIQGHGHYPGTGLQNNFGNMPSLHGGYNQWSQTHHVNENRSGSSDSFTGLLNEPEFN